jgi:signal recognition particle GTPase
MVAASAGEASPLAFVCAGTACATPVRSPEKLANVIRQFGVNGSGKTTVADER